MSGMTQPSGLTTSDITAKYFVVLKMPAKQKCRNHVKLRKQSSNMASVQSRRGWVGCMDDARREKIPRLLCAKY